MTDQDEPPSSNNHHKDKIIKSLISPDRKDGINATFNPSVWPEIIHKKGYPILTRVQKNLEKYSTGTSDTVLSYLISPTKLSEFQKVILSTNKTFAKRGHEDTRIYKHKDTYYLTSIASDGTNPRVVEYKTKNLEKELEHTGIIGPQISLERAIEIVGEKTHYGKTWQRDITKSKRKRKKQLLPIKDASKIYIPNGKDKYKPALIIRASPHIQLITAENENDFLRNDFWEYAIENIEENTILTKETDQSKIGIGSPPIKINGKYIGTYHIVKKSKQGKIPIFEYYGSFYEFDPKTRKITSRIREPLFHPTSEYSIIERNKKTRRIECIKFVNFPSGIIPDIKNDDLYTYMGHSDKFTDVYVTSIKWAIEELKKEHNRQNIIDFSLTNTRQQKKKTS